MLRLRLMRRAIVASALTSVTFCFAASRADAGFIAEENAKTGVAADWVPRHDGTAFADGVADVYPASWSIRRGESLRLKVRSTTDYALHVYRLGWYGGAGAREVATRVGVPADPQPYPVAEPEFGLTRANWHDSLTIATDASWTPGAYVARLDQPGGRQAATFFVVRDGDLPVRPRILMVVGTNTHEAYNAWPGPTRGGKSLYAFNSSPGHPAQGELNQAVKVSYDRPFFAGAGLADFPAFEGPFIRWLEKNGWDVAYCTDQDLHADPSIATGRSVLTLAGHWEYVSRASIDHVRAARDAGTNLLFLTGDTISYQVRFEDGVQTLVGYKESWPNDPENVAGDDAQAAGDLEGAKAHYRMVSRGWRNVGNPLSAGEPGMLLTGLHSGGAFGPNGPWGDLVIDAPEHWLFAGTGFDKGDRITRVMGYEFDTAELGDPAWDVFRPAGQIILGTIVRPSTGERRGNASYYRAASGAEVVALGAVEFAWSLDAYASTFGDSSDPRASRMITNALTRFTASAPTPPPIADAGPPSPAPTEDAQVPSTPSVPSEDAQPLPALPPSDATVADDADVPSAGLPATPTPQAENGSGCAIGRDQRGSPLAVIALVFVLLRVSRRSIPRPARRAS